MDYLPYIFIQLTINLIQVTVLNDGGHARRINFFAADPLLFYCTRPRRVGIIVKSTHDYVFYDVD